MYLSKMAGGLVLPRLVSKPGLHPSPVHRGRPFHGRLFPERRMAQVFGRCSVARHLPGRRLAGASFGCDGAWARRSTTGLEAWVRPQQTWWARRREAAFEAGCGGIQVGDVE